MMSGRSSVVKRHPIITFVVLAYALSWILESPIVFLTGSVTDAQDLVLRILASNVPSVVAIVLTAMVFNTADGSAGRSGDERGDRAGGRSRAHRLATDPLNPAAASVGTHRVDAPTLDRTRRTSPWKEEG
jgi:hypothetical protein